MDIKQISELLKDVLVEANLYSDNAHSLLLGTGAQESRYQYVRQLGNGPARSFWQIEPATAYDNLENYLQFRSRLRERVLNASYLHQGVIEDVIQDHNDASMQTLGELLERNTAFAIVMARIRYYRSPGAIPGNLAGIANYWKAHYNTEGGAGTAEEFVTNYKSLEIQKYCSIQN